MYTSQHTAVEITKGDDHLSIWVDANNNGVRDDDDVNIFVTSAGGFYTESPTFKHALDAHLRDRLKEASLALLQAGHDPVAQEHICELALQLVINATQEAAPQAALAPAEEAGAPQGCISTSADDTHTMPAYYPPLV